MALPTITFNSSTGSDTTASGDNGAASLNGTAASTTAASAVVSLLTDNPDLSSVATDGSQVLWVLSSSGRQFSKITSVDNTAGVKTVTCQSTFANTEGSRTWAIGGKRATFNDTNSRKLFTADVLAGWTIKTETNQTITSAISCLNVGDTTNGPVTITSSSEFSTITQSGNAHHFDITSNTSRYVFSKLKFAYSGASAATNSICINFNCSGTVIVDDCILGDATNKVGQGILVGNATGRGQIVDCYFTACLSIPIKAQNGGGISIIGCESTGGAPGAGIGQFDCNLSDGALVIENSIAAASTSGGGIRIANTPASITIRKNTINANNTDGLIWTAGGIFAGPLVIMGNNFTANGGYGINAQAGQSLFQTRIDYNNFGTGGTANTSGARNNLNAGAHDLAVDPQYTNTGGDNYGVGSNVQDKGFPDATRNIGANQSATVNYSAIGAAEPQVTSGSGGAATLIDGPGLVQS